jgi:hypothetical protein
MSKYEVGEIQEAARLLYENIKADINNASTRLEHIRLTALAQEAANLVTLFDEIDTDLQEGITSNE